MIDVEGGSAEVVVVGRRNEMRCSRAVAHKLKIHHFGLNAWQRVRWDRCA